MTSSSTQPRNSPGHAALTPLLDTLFLLLFAVMASSESKTVRDDAEQEVFVELPSIDESGGGESSPSDVRPVVVTIDELGAVMFGDSASPLATPQDLDRALAGVEPQAVIEIRAHADARHGVVVEVLHRLEQAGLLDVRFVATRRDAEQATLNGWGGAPR